MAWVLSSTGTPAFSESTAALALTAPSGSGGILIALVVSRIDTTTPSTPSGWTLLHSSNRVYFYGRVSNGSGSDSPSISWTGTNARGGVITRWTGGSLSVNQSASQTFLAAQTSPNGKIRVTAITPTVDACLVLRGGITVDDFADFTGAPSGDTLIVSDGYDGTNDLCFALAYRVQTTAGAVAVGDFTNGAASADSYGLSVALEAASSTLYLKLLAHSSAASATGVEGVVLNSTRDAVIGEFTGQAFEASLESGDAVLLIDVADITPDGPTLATTDTPLVAAYNSTDGTVGLGSATVIEV